MKKIIFLGVLIGLLFTQNVQALTKPINTESISISFENTLDRVMSFILHDFPGIIKENFNEKVIPLWREMYQWIDVNIWEKIKPYTGAEIERRKQIAEEESKKEREELIKEIGEISTNNNVLEKIKEFLIDFWK